jgi:2-deoxy-D-gluconate 3-dehydrogenase
MLESRGGVAGQPVPEGGATGNPRGFGKIINVSSLVAFQGERYRYVGVWSVGLT